MKKLENLQDILQQKTKDLYNTTRQQMDALNKLNEKVHSVELKQIISKHRDNAMVQKVRLQKTIDVLKVPPFRTRVDHAVDGLIKNSFDLIKKTEKLALKDAEVIAAIQDLYHYDIAEYGTACAYANKLGRKEVAEVLHQSLTEIKLNDKELSKLAEEKINSSAIV